MIIAISVRDVEPGVSVNKDQIISEPHAIG